MLNIGIVGAGVGGLTCALMLKKLGHKVTIFEKQSKSTSSGVGIQLSSNAIRILRLFDLEDNIASVANFPSMVDCINGHNGNKITSIPLGKIEDIEKLEMEFKENKKTFDPKKIYKDEPNPTEL